METFCSIFLLSTLPSRKEISTSHLSIKNCLICFGQHLRTSTSIHTIMPGYQDFPSDSKLESHGSIELPLDNDLNVKYLGRRSITRFIPSKHSFALVLLAVCATFLGFGVLRHCVPNTQTQSQIPVEPLQNNGNNVTDLVVGWEIDFFVNGACALEYGSDFGDGVNRACNPIIDPNTGNPGTEIKWIKAAPNPGNLQLFLYSDPACTQTTRNFGPNRDCIQLQPNEGFWQVI